MLIVSLLSFKSAIGFFYLLFGGNILIYCFIAVSVKDLYLPLSVNGGRHFLNTAIQNDFELPGYGKTVSVIEITVSQNSFDLTVCGKEVSVIEITVSQNSFDLTVCGKEVSVIEITVSQNRFDLLQ